MLTSEISTTPDKNMLKMQGPILKIKTAHINLELFMEEVQRVPLSELCF